MKMTDFSEIVCAYLETVPGASEILAVLPEPQRRSFKTWPHGETDLFDFLSMAFVQPVLLPELSAHRENRSTLEACFGFIEGMALNPNAYVQNALYFEVYENFLESRQILFRAWAYCGPAARSGVEEMLAQNNREVLAQLREAPQS
ncbi:DUF7674 family protein [Streptomyces coelicoflavus]|uniref:DUF7674 family protein n=1 Tax=Streptomyces coelicoflavus TaxID=285562 RepID=UPI003628C1C4